jgi:hypothetical protein
MTVETMCMSYDLGSYEVDTISRLDWSLLGFVYPSRVRTNASWASLGHWVAFTEDDYLFVPGVCCLILEGSQFYN